MATIGDICETRGEIVMEWRIKDYSSLHQLTDIPYESPKFYFSGASWNIRLYNNGQTVNDSSGWLGLYVRRWSSGSPVNLNYSLGLKSIDGKNDVRITETSVFDRKDYGWGKSKVITKTALMEQKSELIPSDILTVVCSLKNNDRNDVAGK